MRQFTREQKRTMNSDGVLKSLAPLTNTMRAFGLYFTCRPRNAQYTCPPILCFCVALLRDVFSQSFCAVFLYSIFISLVWCDFFWASLQLSACVQLPVFVICRCVSRRCPLSILAVSTSLLDHIASPKWPILCRLGRKTLLSSVLRSHGVTTESRNEPVRRGICGCSDWSAAGIYATTMLAVMWLNAVRICLVFNDEETFGAALVTKITLVPAALLIAVLHTAYYVASHTGSLDRVLSGVDRSSVQLSSKYSRRASSR